jgi:uncharacterized membrane protein YphA (DoxX/SURF4 family)
MIEKYGRKFFLCVLTLLVATALLAAGLLTSAAYVTLAGMTVGVYVAGNVSQTAVESKGQA